MQPDARPDAGRGVDPDVVVVLERVADAVDRRAGRRGHSAAVARWAGELAVAVGLDGREVDRVALAARLHDVPALNRRPHPADPGGAVALRAMVPAGVAALVAAHCERWDGAGLPDGLAGEGVPLGARVLAVADAFVALSAADDPAADGLAGALAELAELELVRRSGSAFDPAVVTAFRDLLARAAAGAPSPSGALAAGGAGTGRRARREQAVRSEPTGARTR